MNLYFMSLVVLAAFTADVLAQCDDTALSKCVADTASGGSNDMCAAFDGMKNCIEMYRPQCETGNTETVFHTYAKTLNDMVPICGGGSGGGCDMQALSGCLAHMQSITSLMGSGSQPTSQDIQQLCDAYSTFQTCIQKLPPVCMESLKSSGMEAGMPPMDQYCGGGSDACDLIGLQECYAPIMSQGPDASLFKSDSPLKSIVMVATKCGVMETAMSCVQPKIENCKDNELMKNMTFVMDKTKMMINFVCKEKKQDIMDISECVRKPEAMPKLGECETNNLMFDDVSSASEEDLCKQMKSMTTCVEEATADTCTQTETDKITGLLSEALFKMLLNGKNPCGTTNGAVTMVSSIWASVGVVIAAIFL